MIQLLEVGLSNFRHRIGILYITKCQGFWNRSPEHLSVVIWYKIIYNKLRYFKKARKGGDYNDTVDRWRKGEGKDQAFA